MMKVDSQHNFQKQTGKNLAPGEVLPTKGVYRLEGGRYLFDLQCPRIAQKGVKFQSSITIPYQTTLKSQYQHNNPLFFCVSESLHKIYKYRWFNELQIYLDSYRKDKFTLPPALARGFFIFCFLFISCNPIPAFAETGIASYYTNGKDCDPAPHITTASGEPFDETLMTCAMPKRDFGKYYKVTNLKNKKSVIVKHNDYGISKKLQKQGRIVDLSKAAFAKIAELRLGLVKVKVEEVK